MITLGPIVLMTWGAFIVILFMLFIAWIIYMENKE